MDKLRTKAAQGPKQHQPQIILGGMMDRLADEIDNAPYCGDLTIKRMWEVVGDFATARFEEIRALLDVRVVDEAPYDSKDGCERMFADIAEGVYYVQTFTSNNPHPFWECHVWKAFRTIHDIDGHIRGNADFTVGGEERTFQVHVAQLPREWRPVIFSETLFQVASTNRNHRFPEFHKALFTDTGHEVIAKLTGTWR